MDYVALLALMIPIVAILAGTYSKVAKARAEAQAQLGQATRHLETELASARTERDRLRTRIEALEAIVTDDGFDLARDARRAGIEPRLDLDALPDTSSDAGATARQARTR